MADSTYKKVVPDTAELWIVASDPAGEVMAAESLEDATKYALLAARRNPDKTYFVADCRIIATDNEGATIKSVAFGGFKGETAAAKAGVVAKGADVVATKTPKAANDNAIAFTGLWRTTPDKGGRPS